jgi:hypothetical protein
MFNKIGEKIFDFVVYKDTETTGKIAFALICLIVVLGVL